MRLIGHETIRNLPKGQEAVIIDFWQWAFSDLKQNNMRGVFSEWLVAQILGLDLSSYRGSWDAYDLITPIGTTIEIKSAAYLQSWHDASCSPSRIVFTGLKGRTWNIKTGYSGKPSYNADVYVFCLQTCAEPTEWSALDINQWRFFYLKRSVFEVLNTKSISLTRLSKLAKPLTANELYQNFLLEGWIN